MPAPTEKTNAEKVLDCVEYMLRRINNANGFYTDGLMVDRTLDPTGWRENKTQDYLTYNAGVVIKNAGRGAIEKLDGKASIGGRRRFDKAFFLWCMVTLTTEQRESGLDLHAITERLKDDIIQAFDEDSGCTISGPLKGYAQGTMSCINLKAEAFMHMEGNFHPDAMFITLVTYEHDRPRRPRTS